MIKIFPLGQIKNNNFNLDEIIEDFGRFSISVNLSDILGDYIILNSGKDAIRAIIEKLYLKMEDEVYISTTTESSFVSSCVSSTIFNYCKLSRVLTEKTKAIFVIHTYGFPNPKLNELRDIANVRGIPLIEDCISAFNSFSNDNIRLGSIGDYAVYSLPKIIPVEYGGILTSKLNNLNGLNDDYLKKNIKLWIPFLSEMRNRTRRNYFYLKERVKNYIYLEDDNVNPYMYGCKISNSNIIMKKLSGYIEFGKTHVKNEIHIPVNPFINYMKEDELIEQILININL